MTTIEPSTVEIPPPAETNPSVEAAMNPEEIVTCDPALGQTALGIVILHGQVALAGADIVTEHAARVLVERLAAAGHPEARVERVRILDAPFLRVVAQDVYERRTGDHGVGGGIGRIHGALEDWASSAHVSAATGADAVELGATEVPDIPPSVEVGTPFTIFLAPEGVESSDGRMLEPMTSTWPDGPIPLMVQDTSSHGAGESAAPTFYMGSIERVYRDPEDMTRIIGRGHRVANEEGERAEQLIRSGYRSVSIDGFAELPPREQPTIVTEDGDVVRVLLRYAGTRIRGATVVSIPAFESACVWFDDEQRPSCVAATHGSDIPLDAPPEVIPSLDAEPSIAALLASAGGPLNPPRAWFTRPEASEYTPLTVTEDGAIYGHIARWGTCHVGYIGVCERAPKTSTSYRYFHTDAVKLADGETIPCGVLTLGTTHLTNLNASADDTAAHYDHTGTAVAKIRATDGRHGIWVSGAVRPGLEESAVWALQGAKGSGDWRDIRDQGRTYRRELVAVLCVNSPGFPIPRPEVLVASGRIVAQIGELAGRCESCEEEAEAARHRHPAAGSPESQIAALHARVGELEAQVRELRAPGIIAAARARIVTRLQA